MDSQFQQFSLSIFPGSEAGETPSSEIHMEVTGDYEKFYERAKKKIDVFDSFRKSAAEQHRSIVRDGDGQTFAVCCTEEEIILALLYCYCWEDFGDFDTVFTKINYRGTVYTNISDIICLMGDTQFYSYSDAPDPSTYPVRLEANKDGSRVTVYFFGPYCQDFGWCPEGDTHSDMAIGSYPMSNGVVEVTENLRYMGMYDCDVETLEDGAGNQVKVDESGRAMRVCDGVGVGVSREGVHAFLKTDGDDAGFCLLLYGKLHPKIIKNGEKVIFCHTSFALRPGVPAEPGEDPKDLVFVNTDGRYRLAGESAFRGVTFTPPPAGAAQNSPSKLYQAYVNALYAAFSGAEEYRNGADVFRREGTELHIQKGDFDLSVKFEPARDMYKSIPQWYGMFSEDWDGDDRPIDRLIVQKAVSAHGDVKVALYPDGKKNLELGLEINGKSYSIPFGELSKRNFFSGAALPKTVSFVRKFSFLTTTRALENYDAVKNAIVSNIKTLLSFLDEMPKIVRGEMEKRLFSDQGLVVDEDVVSFAIEMRNEYERTGRIPNIALIGEAGTGKTKLASRLGREVFDKPIMVLSPSDLKGQYIGHTERKVIQKLVEAKEEQQILFIDEAYDLMKDSFGREAVSILLPLMTGDRTKFETAGENQAPISVEFEPDQIPPIWLAGYEDDMRLMISQNQGLFRRLRRVTLKPPTTGELYDTLRNKLNTALAELSEGKSSGLSGDAAHMNDAKRDELKSKIGILMKQFGDYEIPIQKFFRWGAQRQNSKYFGNYAGAIRFMERCLDGIDFSRPEAEIKRQIDEIILSMKRDIKHQIDTQRRRGGMETAASERVAMIFDGNASFDDLVGCEDQTAEMRTILDMLADRGKYEANGITIPKGALLLGPPGVGKTLIARAMAGELQARFAPKGQKAEETGAGVNVNQEKSNQRVGFMSLSAPELTAKPASFIDSLFDQAEEYDICVIFIDEVDAIAKNRFQNNYYSHFIELIKQMDGMEQRSNIFILAATNAPESLDPAFVRSGRIDRKMKFTLPDNKALRELARRAINKRCQTIGEIRVTKNQKGKTEPLDREDRDAVDKLAEKLAAMTAGYTPGDIENIVNSAFIMYQQERDAKNREPLDGSVPKFSGTEEWSYFYRCLYEAAEQESIGKPRPIKEGEAFSVEKNDFSRSSVAIHEVGHALVEILCGREPFEKITSLPRGDALGYVMPDYKRPCTKADWENDIRADMGGRIAEEIVYGRDNVSAGASADIRHATLTARYLVEAVGFTEEFEFMALRQDTARYLGKSGYSCSEAFREQSDMAVNRLLKKLYRETREMLADKKELIIALARQVFERETMTGEEFKRLHKSLCKEAAGV